MEEEIVTLALISFLTVDYIDELKQSYILSPNIKQIFDLLFQGVEGPKGYGLYRGLLLKGKLVIVPASPFQGKILQYMFIQV